MENVKNKVIDLMQQHFSWLNDDEDTPKGVSNRISSQCNTFDELAIGRDELLKFVDVMKKEFNLDDIPRDEVLKWYRVKDIVDYVKDRR